MKVRAHGRSRNRSLRIAEYTFAVIGILALGYCVDVFVRAQLFQRREARDFSRALQATVARETSVSRSGAARIVEEQPPREGAVIAKLAIARLGLLTMVVEGVGNRDQSWLLDIYRALPCPGSQATSG